MPPPPVLADEGEPQWEHAVDDVDLLGPPTRTGRKPTSATTRSATVVARPSGARTPTVTSCPARPSAAARVPRIFPAPTIPILIAAPSCRALGCSPNFHLLFA